MNFSDAREYVDRSLGNGTDFSVLCRLVREYESDHPGTFYEMPLLYRWEEPCNDPYESNGANYCYLPCRQGIYKQWFHSVSGGCGHGGHGKHEVSTWKQLLRDVKAHRGNWQEKTWELVCEDYERAPRINKKDFEKLRQCYEKAKAEREEILNEIRKKCGKSVD